MNRTSASQTTVSVIVAAYNVDKYLAECLDAIANSVNDGDEVIIVNDGSTDATAEIAEKWCAAHRHKFECRVIHQENRGLPAARRTGFHSARSAYILFADGDDCLLATEYRIASDILHKKNPDILVLDYLDWDPTQNKCTPSRQRSHPKDQLRNNPKENLLLTLRDSIPSVWSRFFKTSLVEKNDSEIFPEQLMYDDLPSTPILTAEAANIYYLPIPLVKYRNNQQGLTKKASYRSCSDMATATQHALQATKRLPPDEALIDAAALMIISKIRDIRRLARTAHDLTDRDLEVIVGSLSKELPRWGTYRALREAIRSRRFGKIKAVFQHAFT